MTLFPQSASQRPTILAGLAPSILGSPGTMLRAAESLQFYAVDMDLRRTLRIPGASHPGPDESDPLVRVRSLWIPGSITGPRTAQRTEALWNLIDQGARSLGLRTIVIPNRNEVTRGEWLGAKSRSRMTAANGGLVRHAIGIRGATIRKGHDQLAQLDMLRHTAEEWDLDIALDLTGDVPHYLEAEAAMLRLLPRLVLVRIPSWVSATGELNTNDPISRRVVSILADQGYSRTISIVPIRAPWQLPWSATAPTTSEEWTRSLILDQYTRQRSDNVDAPYISPELNRDPY